MTKTILPSVKLSLLLFLFISITTLNTACAVSPSEVKVLQDKAALAQQDLRLSLENGEDVSTILPLMQQVKPLADQGEIQQAIQLLDTILIAFERNKVTPPTQINQIFSNPRPVTITGYKQSVMEAFISRDGRYLFFNNEDGEVPKQNKNIYYAERINDTHFKFMGEVKGINSHEVDAVPTMDNDNNFYFVSTAHYGKKNGFNTVYSGKFKNGHVTNIKPHPELSLKLPGWLNMDIEISADGNTLYATHTDFSGGSPPKGSYFFIAHKQYQKFVIDTNSDAIFEHINSDALEYAAAISMMS
ncbi:MAG: hypothetical protein COA63_002305 [Methylophaga sp.]|nr:hypothetical protein [Methylophaga sp.]